MSMIDYLNRNAREQTEGWKAATPSAAPDPYERQRQAREKDLASLLERATGLLAERQDPHQAPYDGPMDPGRASLVIAAEIAALHYTHLRILHLLEDRLGGGQ